jgi:ABC-type uncharacterized transport system ATPase subunit
LKGVEMAKYVAVVKNKNKYTVISSSDNFDDILEACESLSKKHSTLFRGQMISDGMAQLDHQYNGVASQAVCMRKLVA